MALTTGFNPDEKKGSKSGPTYQKPAKIVERRPDFVPLDLVSMLPQTPVEAASNTGPLDGRHSKEYFGGKISIEFVTWAA